MNSLLEPINSGLVYGLSYYVTEAKPTLKLIAEYPFSFTFDALATGVCSAGCSYIFTKLFLPGRAKYALSGILLGASIYKLTSALINYIESNRKTSSQNIFKEIKNNPETETKTETETETKTETETETEPIVFDDEIVFDDCINNDNDSLNSVD